MQIVLASSNSHKVKEINEMVLGSDIEFVLPPEGFDPVETGLTFAQNALIKAKEAWKLSHNWVLADDSGLCIDALNGKPGIYSARYDETPQKRIDKVLNEMKEKSNRTARFVCHMVLISPEGKIKLSCEGICEGSIAYEQKGENGFGYDPIFLLKNDQRTMAELSDKEKNEVSHRANALNQVLAYINSSICDIS